MVTAITKAVKHKPIKITADLRKHLYDAIEELPVNNAENIAALDERYTTFKENLSRHFRGKLSMYETETLKKYGLLREEVPAIDVLDHTFTRLADPKLPYEKFLSDSSTRSKKRYYTEFNPLRATSPKDAPFAMPKFSHPYDTEYKYRSLEKDTPLWAEYQALDTAYETLRAQEEFVKNSYKEVLAAAKTIDELSGVWLDVDKYVHSFITSRAAACTNASEDAKTTVLNHSGGTALLTTERRP